MLNENELKELHAEYYAICDKIHEMEMRKSEIDNTINNNTKEKVASRFIPLEFEDRIRVTKKTFMGYSRPESVDTYDGFFGSWVLDGHQYTADDGEGSVKLRLYLIKKDGKRSMNHIELYAGSITNIEKVEE